MICSVRSSNCTSPRLAFSRQLMAFYLTFLTMGFTVNEANMFFTTTTKNCLFKLSMIHLKHEHAGMLYEHIKLVQPRVLDADKA